MPFVSLFNENNATPAQPEIKKRVGTKFFCYFFFVRVGTKLESFHLGKL